MKILVIDDTKTERMIMTAYLERLGHEVITGADGKQALDLYQSESPDLILMDVIMPVMDGYQSAQQIRQLDDDWVPIIFLSAKISPDDISAGIDAGGDDYLTKPVDMVVLNAKVKAMQRIAAMRHRLIKVSDELAATNNKLQKLVNIDGLTGIANRRYMDRFLQIEYSRAIRNQQPLSLVLGDIDYFKQFNDRYGHLDGDDCLKKVAAVLSSECKQDTDLVARYGGEEFAVILPNTDVERAKQLAENLRQAVADLCISHEKSAVADICTMSLGVASCVPQKGSTAEALLQQADEALYRSKEAGRNRVELFEGA